MPAGAHRCGDEPCGAVGGPRIHGAEESARPQRRLRRPHRGVLRRMQRQVRRHRAPAGKHIHTYTHNVTVCPFIVQESY